eukprot:TRINITY_DN3388_c0_g1_i10.p2 TRINITY_DN3388_c0_g1~~TRINITY_DN3388_c0_g1_i10.p2  ORF type:complete len:319 (+),score=127.01 TRINITY_DN3388_c0_g1_i10:478-1434(+)
MGNKVKISDLRILCKGTSVNEININEFFKDFLARCQEEVTDAEFQEQVCKIEQTLLTMCLGEDNTYEQKELVKLKTVKTEDTSSNLPKEGEHLRKSRLGPDDYTLDEYMMNIKDMVSAARSKKNILKMTEEEVEKFMKDLEDYVDIARKKLMRLNNRYARAKAMCEGKEYKDEYYKNVIKNYQENIYEYQAAREKLAHKVEELFVIENDFKKLKERNEDLDMELLSTTQDLERFRAQNARMEIEINQLKKDNKYLDEEASKARGGQAELKVVIYKLKEKLKAAKKAESAEGQEKYLSLIHICRCRRIERCRSRWSPYH